MTDPKDVEAIDSDLKDGCHDPKCATPAHALSRIVRAQRQRIEELEATPCEYGHLQKAAEVALKDLDGVYRKTLEELTFAEDMLKAKTDEAAALREALDKWAKCSYECRSKTPGNGWEECSCGLRNFLENSKALAPHPSKENK